MGMELCKIMDNKMLITYICDYTYFSNTVASTLSDFPILKFSNSSTVIDDLVVVKNQESWKL